MIIIIVKSHIWIRHREMFWHPKIEICSQFSKIIEMLHNNTSMQKNIYSVMVAVVVKCFIYFIEKQEALYIIWKFLQGDFSSNNSSGLVIDWALDELLLLVVTSEWPSDGESQRDKRSCQQQYWW